MYSTKVDEKNRVVIATKEYMGNDLYESLSKRNIDPIYMGVVLDKFLELPEKITAKARCHELDVFDAEKGKQIAKDKFKVKYKAQCVKRLDIVIEKLKNYIDQLEKFKKRYQD